MNKNDLNTEISALLVKAETDLRTNCQHFILMFDCISNVRCFIFVFSLDVNYIVIFFFVKNFDEHLQFSNRKRLPLNNSIYHDVIESMTTLR